MPPKRDRRHDNPGRPKLKASERQAALELRTRVSLETDKRVRAAVTKSGVGMNKWLRRAFELMVDDAQLLERISAAAQNGGEES